MIRPFLLPLGLTLAFGLAAVSAAPAGTIADAAMDIEALIAADDLDGALGGAKDLVGKVWDMTPFIGFSEALLVEQPASGFGLYNPRPTEVFKPGEPIILYAEPFGFGYGTPGEGLHSIGFHVDLVVKNAAGDVLGDMPNVTELDLTSRYMNREFQANFTYNLTGLEPGKYMLQTTIRDKNSEKSGTFMTTIEIAE